MPLTEPQQHHKAYEQAFNAGNADGILALFEEDGLQAAGEAQRRGAEFRSRLEDQFARGASVTVNTTRVLEANGIALTHSAWELRTKDDAGAPLTLTGHGAEVLRQQSDGSWLLVIDDATGPV